MEHSLMAQAFDIELDDFPFTVIGPIGEELVNIYGRKINQGSPGPDDHPINSTIIYHSWTGGGQKVHIIPASDTTRFDWATLESQFDHYLTLPPFTYTYTGPNTNSSIILGDYPFDDTAKLYAGWGSRLARYNNATNVWDDLIALTLPAVAKGKAYTMTTGANEGSTWFWIPEGTKYDIWNGTTIANSALSAVDFLVMDEKLFRLANDGRLYWQNAGGLTSADWVPIGRITDGSAPRKLVGWVDKSDRPTLYVVTNAGVWALDFDQAILYRTRLQFPRHPKSGHGAVDWGGDLYVSTGMGGHRYNLATISPWGLDRDEGPPAEFRGHLVDMESEYNALYALYQGQFIGDVIDESSLLGMGGGDDPTYFSDVNSNSLLMAWNGIGFHYKWSGSGGTPKNVYVSQADGNYRVWFAVDDKVHMQRLSSTFFNPLDINSLFEFAESGEFISGWYDWGLLGQDKNLKKIEMYTRGMSASENIEVYFQLDDETQPWVLVSTVTTNNEHGFFLGLDPVRPTNPDGSLRYLGLVHERVRLKLIFRRGTEDKTKHPVVDWYALVGRKLLRPQRSWRFQTSLLYNNRGYQPQELADKILELALKKTSIAFLHRGRYYMVDFVADTAQQAVQDVENPSIFASFFTIHLLESNEVI